LVLESKYIVSAKATKLFQSTSRLGRLCAD